MSRAASVGVALGVGVLGGAGLLQAGFAVAVLREEPDRAHLVLLVVLPALTLLGLLWPVRRSRWPLDVRRARRVGLLWLVLGLPAPAWAFGGQAPLALASVAAVPALVGAAWGWARSDDLEPEASR